MKKYGMKLIAAGLIGAMAVFMVGCSGDSSSDGEAKKDKSEEAGAKIEVEVEDGDTSDSTVAETAAYSYAHEIGDVITLGNYAGEDITWVILDVKDGKYFLLSEKALDARAYNDISDAVTWETCTLRTWLNNEFYNEAFSAEEQGGIITTTVTADPNPQYDTDPGNDTQDKVFLLSYVEVYKYFVSDEDRICYPTEHTIDNGIFEHTVGGNGACFWWLRTPGDALYGSGVVRSDGLESYSGASVEASDFGVRPAMWISAE